MSSFILTATNKKTGRDEEIWCLDDYFGRHVYGYISNVEGADALRYEEFEKQYEVKDDRVEYSDWPELQALVDQAHKALKKAGEV